MTEKYITYRWNGKTFDVPESYSADIEKNYPDATIEMRMGDKVFDVPLAHKQETLNKYGSDLTYLNDIKPAEPADISDAQPSFAPAEEVEDSTRKERRRERWNDMLVSANDSLSRAQHGLTKASAESTMEAVSEENQLGRPSWGESFAKGAGAGFTRAGKGLYDALIILSANNTYIDPITGELVKTPDYDTLMREKSDPMVQESLKAGEVADRLSKEADPTGGEKGFVDLISEGKIGMALQKGLATGAESLPMTLSAASPYTMALNMVSMAGANYAEQTLDNPEVDKWKRATMAVGSAALEQAVEKFADPIFKYIGGGGAGEFTEQIAREILEDGTREATEGIAKRILNVLKNTGKDALGEGAEEVITSFGNDMLGEALDLLDGDKDYGIRAQWEQIKEENPDAKLKDFAKDKAKEYMDSFIGGALSGAYMSGVTQTAGEVAEYSSDKAARNAVDASYQRGASMDYGDMYDTDTDVSDAYTAVADSFTDDNGDSVLSTEFIESLSAEDALTLSRREDISAGQRYALGQLAKIKATQEGLEKKLDERLENNIATARGRVDEFADNGRLVTGEHNGNVVYVKGGVIKNGAVSVNDNGDNGPLLVVNSSTGEKYTVNSNEIKSASVLDSEMLGNDIENHFRESERNNRETARNTMSPRAKTNAVQGFIGKKMMVDFGNGITEVEVQRILPKSGEVIIKGKKGDLGGQSIAKMNAAAFYDSISRDDDGNPMFAEVGQEVAPAAGAETAPEVPQTSQDADFRDQSFTILVNGAPVSVDVTGQDDAADRITYEYVDENGNTRSGSSTIGVFASAISDAAQVAQAPEVAPAPEVVPEVPATETPAPVGETPLEPESINWDELFDRDPESYFRELQNQFGEETADILNEEIAAAQSELDALGKAKTTTQNERLENRRRKAALIGKIDTLNGMVSRLAQPAVPATSAVPAAPQTQAPAQATVDVNVPDVSVDKASDARARGYRVTNGQRVDRRGETRGAYGNDIEVAFTADSKGKRAGKVKVIDVADLVPSHISGVENVEHFLPEAQPKKRTDKASTVSATLIAQNMNSPQMTNVASSAYEGAPIVNKRGEVIQGNNRSAAIKEMYQAHADKANEYRQYLIDHAAEYGLDANEIASMQNPVLVREMDVDDTDAISLGQYTMQDMESGGNQMIDSGRAIAGLNNKDMLEQFISVLLSEENDEASDMNLSDLITRNGNAALRLLHAHGIINQTQYQSALSSDGRITPDARAALRGIIEQQLFADGIDNLGVMFEVLPDKAKKGIMQTIARDLKGTEKVTPYIQEAVEVYYLLNQQKDFAAAKTPEEVAAAVNSFANQFSFGETQTPGEKYSNFAIYLAQLFKTSTQKEIRAKFNQLYDAMSGAANIFSEESDGKSLDEAVQEVYGTKLNNEGNGNNGQSGADVLEGGNGRGSEWEQGSAAGVGVRPESGTGEAPATDGGADQTGRGSSEQPAGEVANPAREAQKREKALATQLQRYDISPEQKADMAYNVGKAVGDMFATREEYDAYEQSTESVNLGRYLSDFERGVDDSFANRAQDAGNSQGNAVPLNNEPTSGNNGEQGGNLFGNEEGDGRGSDSDSNGPSDSGEAQGDKGNQKPKQPRGGKGKGVKAGQQVADRYPARKGNATQKLLVDTFGFASVTIPNSRKSTLNSIYDFMMDMAKTLGISPKSIGHGGWVSIGNLRANQIASAQHEMTGFGGHVTGSFLKYKYATLDGIAHEWWHALDHVLVYFNTGKGYETTTDIGESSFTGRKEVFDAVRGVMDAIKASGHNDRIISRVLNPRDRRYLLKPTELAARAFEMYIENKFAEAGITVEGVRTAPFWANPTQEEMAVIAPAFDNLFKILNEKEGKTPGTSVLYHIGEMMDSQSSAKQLATDAVLLALDEGGFDVEMPSDEETEQMLNNIGADPDTQFSIDADKPIFVSNAAMAVSAIKQEKATPEQWLKMIEKNGGLKAGEDKWMGLSDWLKAQDAKTLTKQEVLDFINENTIKIEEQGYGHMSMDDRDNAFHDNMIKTYGQEFYDRFVGDAFIFEDALYGGDWYLAIYDEQSAADLYNEYNADRVDFDENEGGLGIDDKDKIRSWGTRIAKDMESVGGVKEINATRQNYTTKGLTNNKEIALIVPTIEPWNVNDEIHFGDAGNGRAVAWVRFGDAENPIQDENYTRLNQIYDRLSELEMKVSSSGISMEEYEERARLREERDRLQETETKTQKILVIDEIQSKRHQEGRESGYRSTIEKASADYMLFMHRMHEKYDFNSSTPFVDVFNKEELDELSRLDKARTNAYFQKGIPDAPFDKNWSELAMKRMLRYAAENGYDAIAWTKGDQQAERYDIGGAVDSIYYAGSFKEGVKDIDINLDTRRGGNIHLQVDNNGEVINEYNDFGDVKDSPYIGKNLSEILGKELANKVLSLEEEQSLSGEGLRVGGEGMKGFYDKMLPAFMNKYGKKWGVKVEDINLPNLEESARVMHSVPVNDAMRASVMEGQPMFYKTPNGTVYGWTDGKKIYLTKAGINPNTPVHEYTHLWAKAMMLRNPKGWNSIKQLLKGTPVWDEVMNDANYSNIHNDEDMVASEVLSRISGTQNSAKLEQMAQQMIDEAKGTMRKAEARGLIQNIKEALQKFWNWVGTELFGIEKFESVEQVTDRVLWDLVNKTDLGTLSEGQVETQIVTDPQTIAELEASPKRTGFRNVVQNEDGTFSSPMAYWLQGTKAKGGAKSRIETAKFELGKWEEAEEHPELVDDNGHVVLVKPNKDTVEVAYDPYIHNRLDPVNLQFKQAWQRAELVYVETEVAETDLNSEYHADKALLPVGVSSWSNGDLMLSKFDKPVRILPWDEVADAWVARLNGKGVEFDVVPPALRQPLVERGVEILPPHKGMGKDCNEAYEEWKKEKTTLDRNAEPSQSDIPTGGVASESEIAPTVITPRNPKADANIANVTKKAKKNLRDFKNGDLKIGEIKSLSDVMQKLHDYLGMGYRGRGMYATYDTQNGTVDLRVNDHNAYGKNFEKNGAENNISIYVEYFYFDFPESKVPYFEFKYSPKDFEAHTEEIFKEILGAVDMLLNDGFFPSKLTYAEMTPHNIDNIDESILFRASDRQNAAVDNLVGEARSFAIENAVNEEASKLGVNVTYKTRSEMPKGHQNDKGYFNTKTGEIVICTENASSVADAIQTILHEAVAHKGLRQLMGDKFNEFINRVYDSLDAETKAKVDALAEASYNGNTSVAMEEYLASLAETMNFENKSVWDKVKAIFNDIINAILGRNDIKIGDNELRYILRASYNNMVNPRGMETIKGWAQNQMMREELGVNETKPELLSRTGIDPTEAAREIAASTYDKVVRDGWQEFQRQFQDAMQPVRIAIDAIQQETGNIPIEDYENYLLIQNQSSSRSRVEIDDFARRYYSPIIEQVNRVLDEVMKYHGLDPKNKAQRAMAYRELVTYLIAKHGIERNKFYQETKTRRLNYSEQRKEINAAKKDYEDKVNQINADTSLLDAERQLQLRDALDEFNAAVQEIKTREVPDLRDYSGLTSLFGMDPKKYEEAEEEARKLVDEYEKKLGRIDDDATGDVVSQSEAIENLWKRINAATDKTLRHSYESGLLSRQQYNDIKSMFEFYIPLRGFDETTAEDVYSYARFEGNRFNPAVQTAKGRTSVADDPIAIIMNMAESEIAQGNKNRAKQALYNYLLNRARENNQQNSLMQLEDVWYVKTIDPNGNEVYQIAAPDHENGETYDEFENRMKALAEQDKAAKSKKGKVDVGVRFQKEKNKGSHYVYLKVNGVEKAIFVNGDPKAADAINGTYAPKMGDGMSKVKDLQRILSSTFTNYSLEFTARNFFRDMVYSHINIGVRESDSAYRKKFRKNWRHNNMRSMLSMLKAYRRGELDGRALNEDEAAFVEFMNNGGQTGYTLINSVETHKKDLQRAIERMQNGIVKGGVKDSAVFRYTLGAIELLNEVSELVTRFAAFKTSRDMGRGINQSIGDAKEVTVNFNTKGAQDGTGWMGIIARYAGAVKYFFNASVQGVQNIGAMAQKNKGKFCGTVGGMIAFGALMPVFQGMLMELIGGDDEDEYWNIPEFDRQNNLCFVIGKGKYVKVPLPIGFREMYGIGDMIAGGIMNKKFARDPMSVGMDVANKIATIVLPINPLEGSANGLSLIESAQDVIFPDFIQGTIQNRTNKDWKGAPIQKEYTYNENEPQWTKAFASNPSWLTGLSKWCYEHIVIDGRSLDFSPEKLDNTLSNTFGGIYSLIKKTGRSVSMAWNEDNRNMSNIPLVGVIIGSGVDKDERFVNSTYWEMDEYYNERIATIKRTAEQFGLTLDEVFKRIPDGEAPAGAHHPKMSKIYSRDNFDFMQEWYLGHKGEGDKEDLGLDQIRTKIKGVERKIKKNEGAEPTVEQLEELARWNNEYEVKRRELVDDLLELD